MPETSQRGSIAEEAGADEKMKLYDIAASSASAKSQRLRKDGQPYKKPAAYNRGVGDTLTPEMKAFLYITKTKCQNEMKLKDWIGFRILQNIVINFCRFGAYYVLEHEDIDFSWPEFAKLARKKNGKIPTW